jgi:hypothetical protein
MRQQEGKVPSTTKAQYSHRNMFVADSMFYPHPCHHEFIGTELYDYYGFI